MRLPSLLRTLPALLLAATLGTAAAKPKATPSPAAATQDASAQTAASPAAGAKRTVSPDSLKKRYLTELKNQAGLTADQEPKVTPIINKYVDDREAVKADASLTTTAKNEKFKTLRGQYVSDVNAVLTPAQRTKWAAFAEARRAKLKAARAKGAAANANAAAGTTEQSKPAATNGR